MREQLLTLFELEMIERFLVDMLYGEFDLLRRSDLRRQDVQVPLTRPPELKNVSGNLFK